MDLNKQVYQPDRKNNPLFGLFLFLVSVILWILTTPFGFLYGIFHALFTKGLRGLGNYFLEIAVSLDQLGNVTMQHLLNDIWAKKGGYKFGNRDETISSALGRNHQLRRLTVLGKVTERSLHYIDPEHAFNSIDYYVEPTIQIIEKLAWIHLVEGKLFCIRRKEDRLYQIPGGVWEGNQLDALVLISQIKNDLGVSLQPSNMDFIGIFEAPADGRRAVLFERKNCYYGKFEGAMRPSQEIVEQAWLNYSDHTKVSQVDALIFDFLRDKGKLT